MSGHWERDGEEFHNLDEMWDYIRDNENYFDEVDFERWLNDNFTAAQIVWRSVDDDIKGSDGLWLAMQEEFEDCEWSPRFQDSLEEGYDYNYGPCGEFEFKWVEDDEDDSR